MPRTRRRFPLLKNFPARLEAIAKAEAHGKVIEIWFADEARIGQKNKITRRWAKRGTRPSAPKDQRTASAYIFGAICPAEGKGAGLVLPRCTTEGMTLHLKKISQAVTPGAHALVLVDQAGWHQSKKLVVPDNVTLMPLPAKSLFEWAISRIYAVSAVSALSLEQALACKTGFPLLARSLWAGFRQPRRRSFFGQVIGIPHSNRLLGLGSFEGELGIERTGVCRLGYNVLLYGFQRDAVQVPRPGAVVRLPSDEVLFDRVNRSAPGSPVVKEQVTVEVEHQKRLVACPACPLHTAGLRLILAGQNELTAGRVRRGWCKQASGGKRPNVAHAKHHRPSSDAETDGIVQGPPKPSRRVG